METTWQKNWKPGKEYPSLKEDIKSHVAIVGGGITGITLAYLLAKEGKDVVVLEKGTLRDSSYTAYTTAMIMAEVDTAFVDLIKIFGRGKAKKVWEAGMEAIDLIEKIVKEEKIDCEFVKVPAYIYANDKKEWSSVKEEFELLKKYEFPVKMGEKGKLDIVNTGYYELAGQAKFHPLKYCDGVRVAAEKLGAKFYENTEVLELKDHNVLHTKGGDVMTNWVVIATYEPFNKPKELFAHKGMYMSYMYELSIPKNVLKEALYVDNENPYHYFRVDAGEKEDRLIIGGADHRKEIKMDPDKNYKEVLDYAGKILEGKKYKVENKWRGGILESWDGLPFIGQYSKNHPNILVATGFSGNGMTYSHIAGVILRDMISGNNNIYSEVFDPKRGYSLKAAWIKGRDYLEEFFGGAIRNLFK